MQIKLNKYANHLATQTEICDELKTINLIFGAGGLAGYYSVGIAGYINSLVLNKKIQINNIYGTSCGALISVVLIQSFKYRNFGMDESLNYSNNELKLMYKNSNMKITDSYRKLLEDILTDDIHELCTDKLFINFYVLTKYGLQQRCISKYTSKQHVINCVVASASIPYISINSFCTKYLCPFESTTYMAFDGIKFNKNMLKDTKYQTIYVNISSYNYDIIKRMIPIDNCIEKHVINGIYDMYYLLTEKKQIKTLYIYDRNKQKTSFLIKILKSIRRLVELPFSFIYFILDLYFQYI